MKKMLAVFLALGLVGQSLAKAEIVVDDFSSDCKLIGNWADSKGDNPEGGNFSGGGTVGNAYHYTSSHGRWARTGKEKAIFTPKLPKAGKYKVEVSWRGTSNRTKKATYEVVYKGGKSSKTFDQSRGNAVEWGMMGEFEFDAGTSGYVAMISDGGKSACVDAARFTYVGASGPSTGTPGSGGGTDDMGSTIGTPGTGTPGTGTPGTGNPGTGTSPGGEGSSKTLRCTKRDMGPKTYTFTGAGKAKLTADLTTYESASLKAVITKKDGKVIEWVTWERANDVDSSPMKVNGKEIADSIVVPKPGDYSSTATSTEIEAEAGDVFEISLSGSFGKARPFIQLRVTEFTQQPVPVDPNDPNQQKPGNPDDVNILPVDENARKGGLTTSGKSILFKGKPVKLGAFAFYAEVADTKYDWRDFLLKLSRNGVNYSRVWIPFQWSKDGMPFEKSGGKYDLSKFDEIYFKRLSDYVAAAAGVGVAVQVTLYDSCGLESASRRWEESPWNTKNNVNGMASSGTEIFKTEGKWGELHKAYIKKVTDTLGSYGNVIYEIMNEPNGGYGPESWLSWVAAQIKGNLAGKSGSNLVSTVSKPVNDKNVDIIAYHLTKFEELGTNKTSKPVIWSTDGVDEVMDSTDSARIGAYARKALNQGDHFEHCAKIMFAPTWKSKDYDAANANINQKILAEIGKYTSGVLK